MPRAAKMMNAMQVDKQKSPGLYAAGGVPGLHLQVTVTGENKPAKSWIVRLTVGTRTNAAGKTVPHRRDFGLGSYPGVSLSEARAKADEYRALVQRGEDPRRERDQKRAAAIAGRVERMTVTQAVERYIADMEEQRRWDGDKAGYSKRRAWLDTWIKPHIGSVAMEAVSPEHAVIVFKAVREGAPSQEEKISGLLGSTFDWAKVKGYASGDNPFRYAATKFLLTPRKKGGRMTALPYAEVPALMADLRDRTSVTADALKFLVLTAVRTSDVIGASWKEFDLKEGTWTIPKERLKMGRDEDRTDHVVPLTEGMLAVLAKRQEEKINEWVFPSPSPRCKGKPLSDGAMLGMLQKQMGYTDEKGKKITGHGFRSAFSTWASEETEHHSEVREMALSHQIKNFVESRYRRGDLLKKRRAIMSDWGRFCASAGTTTARSSEMTGSL